MDENSRESVFCSACFRIVPNGRRVCLNCSEPLLPDKATAKHRKTRMQWLFRFGVALLITAFLFDEAMVFFGFS
ncbi:hypothetical protein FM037_11100 [Shewanella psychropiezotolerans]|uniref:Zinc ribbon domain-containing protein n=1 Tax=Shewanella psychropiezotolerans TaxID=2593655 RepID=A0ABX5WX69_9GAMM|nr:MULTISPECIES: hypothetical protein [Shewanella]MPY26721.1 hypothetical protein [Shewanella sp. YLB-07]QDO83678.1 hypothetical protein FM037_11100 [Shewanella psychropiezotolerans]